MKRLLCAAFAATLALSPLCAARADDKDKDAVAVIDKAVKALGGEEKLAKVEGHSWKTKGVISVGGNEIELSGTSITKGLSHHKGEMEADANGQKFKVTVVVKGDKGWRKINDDVMPLDDDGLTNEKRRLYLQAAATLVLPLKGKDFKVTSAGEEKVGDKPAAVLKVTGPDGKDFKLFFDKDSGLLVKQVATVPGFMPGEEFEQETVYKDYKDFGGIKAAAKHEAKRNGDKFLDSDITDVKFLEKIEDGTFAEPQ